MEPLSAVVTAISAGAAAGLQGVASAAAKDAYDLLKDYLKTKFPSVSVSALEEKPESEPRMMVVEEDLRDAGATRDVELITRAQSLLRALEEQIKSGESFGVKLDGVIVKANANITEVFGAVVVQNSTIEKDLNISNVGTGRTREDDSRLSKKKPR